MDSILSETSHDLVFTVKDLQECLKKGDAVEALILLPLIGQAVAIKNQIDALISARDAINKTNKLKWVKNRVRL